MFQWIWKKCILDSLINKIPHQIVEELTSTTVLAANFSINNNQHQWTLEFTSQTFCHFVNQSNEALLWLFGAIFVALIVGFATDLPQTTPLHKLQVSSPVIYAISSAYFRLFFDIPFLFKSWVQRLKKT